jgi:hypothetical protein
MSPGANTYGLNLKFQKAIRGQAGCQHHPIDITMRYPAASFPVCTLKPERLAKGKRDVHKFINSCFSPVPLPFLWLFFLSFTKIVNSGCWNFISPIGPKKKNRLGGSFVKRQKGQPVDTGQSIKRKHILVIVHVRSADWHTTILLGEIELNKEPILLDDGRRIS